MIGNDAVFLFCISQDAITFFGDCSNHNRIAYLMKVYFDFMGFASVS